MSGPEVRVIRSVIKNRDASPIEEPHCARTGLSMHIENKPSRERGTVWDKAEKEDGRFGRQHSIFSTFSLWEDRFILRAHSLSFYLSARRAQTRAVA